MTTKTEHRKILDELFNAFTILGRGNYVSLYDVKENISRYSPAAVEIFGLTSEYLPADYKAWEDYIHPEDRFAYARTMKNLLSGDFQSYDFSCRTRLKDGTYANVRYIGATINDADGKPDIIGGII